MVFKVVTGIEKHIWNIYTSRFTSAEFVTAALDLTTQHLDHYKNRVLLNWGNFNPTWVSFIEKKIICKNVVHVEISYQYLKLFFVYLWN